MIFMDLQKSLKIAGRRFQNGNYLLSVKKYPASRKEFEVALKLYDRANANKEMAETLNNIGITLVKEGMASDAKDYFKRSYELKKEYHYDNKESLFNTLYNLLGVGSVLDADEFEKYLLELKSIGEELGGEYINIVAKEKIIYDRIVEARAEELRKRESEELARSSPAGALEHLMRSGIPCTVAMQFIIYGLSINIHEPFIYKNNDKRVKLIDLVPVSNGMGDFGGCASMGRIEFEAPYEQVERLIGSGAGTNAASSEAKYNIHSIEDESFEHVKKFIDTIRQVREDINFILSKKDYTVTSAGIKNAFGELMEIYNIKAERQTVPVVLSTEDAMLVNMLLSADGQSLYKLLLMNAKRLLDEENYSLCIINTVDGFESFLDLLLKQTLPEDLLHEYSSITSPGLDDRMKFLTTIISTNDKSAMPDPLSNCELDKVLVLYKNMMSNTDIKITQREAENTFKIISTVIYGLKSLYGI